MEIVDYIFDKIYDLLFGGIIVVAVVYYFIIAPKRQHEEKMKELENRKDGDD